MTAYEAFLAVLDINETIEVLKQKNTGDACDPVLAVCTQLLTDYRTLLKEEMKSTELKVFQKDT